MFAFLYMSFATGFNNFVEQEEKKHIAHVKQQLTELYSELGNWQPITQNTPLWRSIVAPQKKQEHQQDETKDNSSHHVGADAPPPAPSLLWINLPVDSLKTGQRISLYNKDKKVIVGKENLNDNKQIEPMLLKGQLIGWLGFMPSHLVQSSPAEAFISAQFHNYFMVTLMVILLAFTMAILLSRHLIEPIEQIIVGTKALNVGNFASRIKPTTHDELATLADNVNALAETLEQNRESRFQWMSDTSHELRTPLSVLRSHLIAVQDGVFVADSKRISLLLSQVDTLSHIVDGLAQLSRTETASLTYDATKVDVINSLEHSLERYSSRFEQQNLTIDRGALTAAGKCIIIGDKERLQQLFVNLLENTCRYTDSPGQLIVKANKVDYHVELLIQDSAPGVCADDLAKLFDRFFRVEKSRNRELGGSGLGLALCKQIVDAHGGRISLHDSPLGGLEVKVVLPLAEA
ncbi:ATP-binding protein [Paraglaciecola mesophila]|nr:ATP-binding protein [Paraglaciecola mesophila]